MLLNNGAAVQVADLDEPWADGVRTRIRPGLFAQIATDGSFADQHCCQAVESSFKMF
jgi:hypothetical protein